MAPHGNRRISASNSLSLRQRSSLRAIVDALLPPLPVPNAAVTKDAEKEESNNVAFSFSSATTSAVDAERMYWEHRLSADSAFMNAVELAITEKLSAADNFKMKIDSQCSKASNHQDSLCLRRAAMILRITNHRYVKVQANVFVVEPWQISIFRRTQKHA